MFDTTLPNRKKLLVIIICLIAVPVLIYFYFLKWKTDTAYGDDLNIFKTHAALSTFYDKISIPQAFGKYRPVHGLLLHLLIEWFQKNIAGYYIFNIAIQAINVFIFAAILNLFLRSFYFSLLFAFIIGVSRFSFFNISQLLNGGALEGLAITFFLLSLLFILRTLKHAPSGAGQSWLLWGILFANLSMYTHERYIVIIPFVILVILLSPDLKTLTRRKKVNLILLCIASIGLNVILKKYVYSMPFFMGTAGADIKPSFSSAFSFFREAVLSIFQINIGPEYLVGIKFSSLSFFDKMLVILFVAGMMTAVFLFVKRMWKTVVSKQTFSNPDFSIFLLLFIPFFFFLLPAVITIRLEQRWLQASLSVFILMMVIALCNLEFRNNYIRNAVLSAFAILFLWTDFNYLNKGGDNLYMSSSERIASDFEPAVRNGMIRPGTTKLYIWEKKKDVNTENAISWCLGYGYFFEFYQGKSKKVVFVDSIYQRSYSFPVSSFVHFDKKKEQIVYIANNDVILDITNNYLQDSLKSFNPTEADAIVNVKNVLYNEEGLMITNDDFDKFMTRGFYENENGIRWTNGNASIGFKGDYTLKDSVRIELNTYMPPVCKDVVPEISLTDILNKEYRRLSSGREGDKFIFTFYFAQPTAIRKINILSKTINAAPDKRTLSFLFISLEIKKHPVVHDKRDSISNPLLYFYPP